MSRCPKYLAMVYQQKTDKILASSLYTGGDIFDRGDAGRVLKVTGDEAMRTLDRMSDDGFLDTIYIKMTKSGTPTKFWKKKTPSKLKTAWVRPWVQSLDYSPQWR